MSIGSMGSVSEDGESVCDVNITHSSMDEDDEGTANRSQNATRPDRLSSGGLSGTKERNKSGMSESTTGTGTDYDDDETDNNGELDPLARLLTTPTREDAEESCTEDGQPAQKMTKTEDKPSESKSTGDFHLIKQLLLAFFCLIAMLSGKGPRRAEAHRQSRVLRPHPLLLPVRKSRPPLLRRKAKRPLRNKNGGQRLGVDAKLKKRNVKRCKCSSPISPRSSSTATKCTVDPLSRRLPSNG